MNAITELGVLSKVVETVESTLKMPAGKLDIDAEFESFGMDSIIAMELMSNLSKKLNIAITPAQFTAVNTVRELADYIDENLLNDKVPKSAEIKVEPAKIKMVDSAKSSPTSMPMRKVLSSRPLGNRSLVTNKTSFKNLLDFVKGTYAIDLGNRKFKTLDEIVDTLVANNFEDLIHHFDLDEATHVNDSASELKSGSDSNKSINRALNLDDIAIVGIGCKFPEAANHQIFWNNLLDNKVSIKEIPESRWDWKKHYANSITPGKTVSKWGALINDVDCFDADFFNIPEKDAKLMDPQERLFLQEVYNAFQDAAIDPKKLSGSKTGVFVGYEYSEYEHYLRKNIANIQDAPVLGSSSPTYYLANRLSFIFDFCGPSESINTNCASSAVAVNRAYYSLLSGESDVAIAGGVSLNLFVGDYIATTQFGMLSPNGTCAVFDDSANGFTRGEGVAAIVLKRLSDAEKDNNKIYGVIKSSHQNNRGKANFISEIKHESITDVLSDCYKKAAVDPASISYIEVDGYSTKWGDSFEFEGIKNAFKDFNSSDKYCALGSVKGNIGHLEPASGIVSVIKVALSLHNKTFPATITKKELSKFIDIHGTSHPLYIADTAIPFDAIRKNQAPIRAGVNSFADSGANVHILLEEYVPTTNRAVNVSSSVQNVFVFSAKDSSRLIDLVTQTVELLSSTHTNENLSNIAYTLQIGREAMDYRLAVIASSATALLDKLLLVMKAGQQDPLDLEDKGIYRSNLQQTKKNPLVGLITKGLDGLQLEQSLENQQWQTIALLWINGVVIPWEKAWEGKSVTSVSLSTYPFAKKRYWVDLDTSETIHSVALPSSSEPVAKISALVEESSEVSNIQSVWIFSADTAESGDDVITMDARGKIELFLKQEVSIQLKKSIQDISTTQNFIELGFDSIGIADLIFKAIQLLQQSISPSVVFKYPDIDSLSQYLAATYRSKIDALVVKKKVNFNESSELQESIVTVSNKLNYSAPDDLPPIVSVDKSQAKYFPLSLAQEKLFFLNKIEEGVAIHNVPVALSISGQLDVEILEQAFNLVIARHDSLRTLFQTKGGQVQQVILDSLNIKVEHIDLSQDTNKDEQQTANKICLSQAKTKFDLEQGPLIKLSLITLAPQEKILMLTMHHIISDGWSAGIFIKELGLVLDAKLQGKSLNMDPLPIQYQDYCVWQKQCLEEGGPFESRLAYWREKLNGVQDKLDLAIGSHTSGVQANSDAASFTFKLSAPRSEHVKTFAMQQGCTLYMTLMAAFKVLFYRYSGQKDICIGSVNANRDFETAGLIGCFFNVNPIRTLMSPTHTFVQLLLELKNTLLDAMDYQVPIETILASHSNKKIVNILFNQLPPTDSVAMPFGDAHIKLYNYGQDENLNLSDLSIFIGSDSDGVRFELTYDKSLYTADAIKKLSADYSALLEALVNNNQSAIDDVSESIGLHKRKAIRLVSSYSVDPIFPLANLILNKMPGKPMLSIGGYNQVIQELLADCDSVDTTLAINLMLEDCYKYNEAIDLDEKIRIVKDYIHLLMESLSASNIRSIQLLVHEISLEKIVDAKEYSMLVDNRNFLLHQVKSIPTVILIDEASIKSQYAISMPQYDDLLYREAHIPFTHDYFLGLGMGLLRSFYSHHIATEKKVIVLDCDNTLWQGEVGEDGIEGVVIAEHFLEFQQQIKQKKDEGYLIALCSKNNEVDVAEIFSKRSDMVLKLEDFAIKKINWNEKSHNIKEISLELNVGLDSVVFLDDNAFEIAELRSHCPEVLSFQLPQEPAGIASFVNNLWCFDKKIITQEDQQRNEINKADTQRNALKASIDYTLFIKQLAVEVYVDDMAHTDIDRVSQLTYRTNQFNAYKHEYTQADIADYLAQSNHFIKVVRVKDRFGDYGLVGLMMYERQESQIQVHQFLLSCRALGRNVEEVMLKALVVDASINKIIIPFIKTSRNQPIEHFLEILSHFKSNDSYEYSSEEVHAFSLNHKRIALTNDQVESTSINTPNDSKVHNDTEYVATRAEELFLAEIAEKFSSISAIQEQLKNYSQVKVNSNPAAEKYLAPNNVTEQQLANIWADILNLDVTTIGVHDDFFVRGGHSLLALKLIAQIETSFKKSLPLSVVFTAPNITALAKLVLGEESASSDILVPIQTAGNKSPIFAMPGAAGSVVSLQQLSQALGKTQPFYGLQAVGLDGHLPPLASVEEIAEANITALKKIKKKGPYHLLGYSNGGVVAYEMTRLLLLRNEKVASLTLIDTLSPQLRTSDEVVEVVQVCKSVARTFGSDLNLDAQELQNIPADKRSEFLFDIVVGQGFDMTSEQFNTFYNVAIASERACRAYRPEKLPRKLDIALYRAIDGYPTMPSDYGWNEVALTPVQISDIQADHLSIMYKAPIQQIAKDILSPAKKRKK